MTDKEIIKALECLEGDTNCEDCAFHKKCKGKCVFTATLDLITRQQTEIKSLQKEVSVARDAYISIQDRYEHTKSEAYKAFAERLKKKIINTPFGIDCTGETDEYREGCLRGLVAKQHNVIDMVDNLLKEMVGENNE